MPDAIVSDRFLRIQGIGCEVARCALLGLEPGSRIWLSIDGAPTLFQRMDDDDTGKSTGVKPVAARDDISLRWSWTDRPFIVDVEFIERPLDVGEAAKRFVNDFGSPHA